MLNAILSSNITSRNMLSSHCPCAIFSKIIIFDYFYKYYIGLFNSDTRTVERSSMLLSCLVEKSPRHNSGNLIEMVHFDISKASTCTNNDTFLNRFIYPVLLMKSESEMLDRWLFTSSLRSYTVKNQSSLTKLLLNHHMSKKSAPKPARIQTLFDWCSASLSATVGFLCQLPWACNGPILFYLSQIQGIRWSSQVTSIL